jgi:hypothetical protein
MYKAYKIRIMRRQPCIKRVSRTENIIYKLQKELLIIAALRIYLILSILLKSLE